MFIGSLCVLSGIREGEVLLINENEDDHEKSTFLFPLLLAPVSYLLLVLLLTVVSRAKQNNSSNEVYYIGIHYSRHFQIPQIPEMQSTQPWSDSENTKAEREATSSAALEMNQTIRAPFACTVPQK